MRGLQRNKQAFYYSTYLGKTEVLYEGKRTGVTEASYSEPTWAKANISHASGSSDATYFGKDIQYDKVIVLVGDEILPIDEYSILWIDELDTTKPHDYEVSKVAKSLNVLALAIKRVNVND